MAVTPMVCNRGNEVVVAVTKVVLVVAKIECGIGGHLEPDTRARRRIEIRTGGPG